MLIYERLKVSRKECKLTQKQVADMLGIDRSTYAYYELGVSIPSIENLITLAAVFNVDFTWLAGADKSSEQWNSPEGELQVLLQAKEKRMSELTKDERLIVSLYRIAGKNGYAKDFYDNLFRIAGAVSHED